MTGDFLLDTNIVIGQMNGALNVEARLGADAHIWLTATVLGELYFGAARSGRVAENSQKMMSSRLI
ncbi:MAG TPA: hypothetical protein VIL86_13260 [Tepidisphaeraceae bacterium]